MDTQHGHGHALWTWTCSMGMDTQHSFGNAACIWTMNMDAGIITLTNWKLIPLHFNYTKLFWTGSVNSDERECMCAKGERPEPDPAPP
jgi:hypothetical protein